MHLTRRDHGPRLERFHDIRPARRRGARCGSPEPGSARGCTRPRDHRGPHAAHGALHRVLAILFLGLVAWGLSVAFGIVAAW